MKRKRLFLAYSCILLTYSILIGCRAPNQVFTTATPSITAIQVTLGSSTVVPTLPVSQANARLLELMANNGNCELPCFWNITPGKSSFQDALMILMPLTSISEFSSFKAGLGTIYPNYSLEDDLEIPINISFLTYPDNQTVTRIAFIARVLKKDGNGFTDLFDLPFFSKQFDYYMLPNILTQYGEPSTVMLSTMAKLPSSGVSGGFKLLLLYPEKGILVNYTMQMQVTGENIMGCPSNAHLELQLYPSGQADSFFDLLEPSGWTQIIQNTYKPLDEATSLSQEEFFKIFRQSTNECVLTPASLWPMPN